MRDAPQHRASQAFVVMGVSGSGKSTFGLQLARHWGAPFLEGDEFHPPQNVAKMRAGVPLEDDDRWPWLDQLAQGFASACAQHPRVVGACSALRRIYRERLRERIPVPVRFICLEADEPYLLARMKSRIGHYMPPALLSSQLATLERPDPDERAICLASNRPLQDLLEQVERWSSAG